MANAEVVLDSSFEINLDETTRVQTYDKNAAKGDMDSYLYLYISSNNEDFDHLSAYGVEQLGNYYYSINGAEFVKITDSETFDSNRIQIYFEDIKDVLETTNELELTVYFETVDKTVKTKDAKIKVLVTEDYITLEDSELNIKVMSKYDTPYGTTLKAKEITDQEIIKNIAKNSGFTNLTVWEIDYTAFGKSMAYYKEHYGYNEETSNGMIWSVEVTLPVPSKYDHKEELDIMAYMVSKDYKNVNTQIQFGGGDESDLTKYTLTLFDEEYMDYYFVMSDKTKFVSEETPKDQNNVESPKDDSVESPETGVKDYALYIGAGIVTAIGFYYYISKKNLIKKI